MISGQVEHNSVRCRSWCRWSGHVSGNTWDRWQQPSRRRKWQGAVSHTSPASACEKRRTARCCVRIEGPADIHDGNHFPGNAMRGCGSHVGAIAMELVASGLVISVILGAFAMGVVMRLTCSRRCAPLSRGRVERAIEYGASVLGGLLTLLTLLVVCPEVTPASQEAALIGIIVAMPVSAPHAPEKLYTLSPRRAGD